jgi:hypothetical protein
MPNTFTDNRDRWLQMSEVDYLGQFVKAWLAFNAWYRSAYNETRDREIIDEIKWNPNPIAARFRPLLSQMSEEAKQFRTEIGLLYHRLEDYELHYGKGAEKSRIRLSKIVIRTEPPTTENFTYWNYHCNVERNRSGAVNVVVTDSNGTDRINLQQLKFDLSGLEADSGFQGLPDGLKQRCCRCYGLVNPRVERDLRTGDKEPIMCGIHSF